MHAFLLESVENPHTIDLISAVPEQFETVVFYEISSIGEVREFKKSWVYSQPTKTLCVISHLDDAKEEAQNAILKMLEEPPHANLMFLLLVTNQSRIIPTILSRVTVIRSPKTEKTETKQTEDVTITFELVSKTTDRDDAIKLLANKKSESALKAIEALKKNGNVTLQLTNYLLSQNKPIG